MKKQENLLQTKEQDNYSEMNLNEMEITDFLDRVQNNGHKYAH